MSATEIYILTEELEDLKKMIRMKDQSISKVKEKVKSMEQEIRKDKMLLEKMSERKTAMKKNKVIWNW